MNKGLFSSMTAEWETPQDLFDRLNALFDFELDVCATPENAKCARFYTKEDDAIVQPWAKRNWMNPPYGKEIAAFCAKASEMGGGGARTVALLPARTDTQWFHDYCTPWHIQFLRGRLKFRNQDGKTGSAPFPSIIVYFGIPRG